MSANLRKRDTGPDLVFERFDERMLKGVLLGAEPQSYFHGRTIAVLFRIADVAAMVAAPQFKQPHNRVACLALMASGAHCGGPFFQADLVRKLLC